MEEALQHQAIPQCPGLPPAGPGNHRPDGPKASHALTLKLDHSGGADHRENARAYGPYVDRFSVSSARRASRNCWLALRYASPTTFASSSMVAKTPASMRRRHPSGVHPIKFQEPRTKNRGPRTSALRPSDLAPRTVVLATRPSTASAKIVIL